jgi:hypothetical protein
MGPTILKHHSAASPPAMVTGLAVRNTGVQAPGVRVSPFIRTGHAAKILVILFSWPPFSDSFCLI